MRACSLLFGPHAVVRSKEFLGLVGVQEQKSLCAAQTRSEMGFYVQYRPTCCFPALATAHCIKHEAVSYSVWLFYRVIRHGNDAAGDVNWHRCVRDVMGIMRSRISWALDREVRAHTGRKQWPLRPCGRQANCQFNGGSRVNIVTGNCGRN